MIAWTKAKARMEIYFERNVDRIEDDWWMRWEKKTKGKFISFVNRQLTGSHYVGEDIGGADLREDVCKRGLVFDTLNLMCLGYLVG